MKNTVQEMTCIVCPNGCRLQVMEKDGKIEVTGATCKKGVAFAENELKNPTRSIASTVKTIFPGLPLCERENRWRAAERADHAGHGKDQCRHPEKTAAHWRRGAQKRMRREDRRHQRYDRKPRACRVHGARAKKHKQASSESNSENRRYTAMALSKKRCPILSDWYHEEAPADSWRSILKWGDPRNSKPPAAPSTA